MRLPAPQPRVTRMTALLFPAPDWPTLPVEGSDARFPVRRVFCVGRNYAAHAREMGRDPDREPPFFFTAWAETVVPDGTTIAYPSKTGNFHYEAELPLVVLLENGFPPLYKPPKRYFEACAQGRLLMLAPWPYHSQKRVITREQCLALNGFAARLASP